MARNFPCFLTAYSEYARDGFVPDRFHEWVGRSILAAALERKVTLKQGRVYHCPNIYVMLVSHPAVGKSTAIDAGCDLIEKLRKDHKPHFRIIPNQATEPALIDMMKIIEKYPLPVDPNILLSQSAGFFYASEASASALQNTCGDFVAAMTAFYDCPRYFRKKTKGEKDETVIENSCMNMLAGSTFNYLKTLVNEQSVLGGFASRLIYVVESERTVKHTKWGESRDFNSDMGRKLVADLAEINKLVGPMRPTQGFTECWEAWKPEFDQFIIDLSSERRESINSRKGTNLLKLSMILSVSESDDLVLTEKHFEQALGIIEDVYKDTASILTAAALADKTSQAGVTQLVGQTLKKNGGSLPMKTLKNLCLGNGNDLQMISHTIDFMLGSGAIQLDPVNGRVLIVVDPDTYL